MTSVGIKKATATALAGAAIVSSLCAPAVSARPAEQFMPGAAGDASDSPSVPPPPSSIAIPAGEQYTELRQAADRPTAASQPAVDESSSAGGFDLPSAAIGAATGAGLVMLLLAAGVVTRRRPLTRRHGAIGA
jgi:hypothetical protein